MFHRSADGPVIVLQRIGRSRSGRERQQQAEQQCPHRNLSFRNSATRSATSSAKKSRNMWSASSIAAKLTRGFPHLRHARDQVGHHLVRLPGQHQQRRPPIVVEQPGRIPARIVAVIVDEAAGLRFRVRAAQKGMAFQQGIAQSGGGFDIGQPVAFVAPAVDRIGPGGAPGCRRPAQSPQRGCPALPRAHNSQPGCRRANGRVQRLCRRPAASARRARGRSPGPRCCACAGALPCTDTYPSGPIHRTTA